MSCAENCLDCGRCRPRVEVCSECYNDRIAQLRQRIENLRVAVELAQREADLARAERDVARRYVVNVESRCEHKRPGYQCEDCRAVALAGAPF